MHFLVRRGKEGVGSGDAQLKAGSKCRLKLDTCADGFNELNLTS